MAQGERRSRQQNVSEALRDAVQRTVQSTVGSAQLTRGRAQEAVDEIVRGAEARAGAVRSRVRSAEAGAEAVRDRVLDALVERRPATAEDLKEIHRDLRLVARRLDALEKRLAEGSAPPRGGARGSSRGGGSSSGGGRSSGGRSSRGGGASQR